MPDRLDGSSNQCGSSVSFAVLLCEIPNDARSRAVQKLLIRGSEAGERESCREISARSNSSSRRNIHISEDAGCGRSAHSCLESACGS